MPKFFQKTAPTPQFSIEEEKQNGDLLHLLTKSKENDFNSTKNNNDAIINEHSSSEYKFDKNLKHFFSDKIILESQNNHKENIILSSNIELFSENADNNNFLIPDKRQEKETKSFSKEKILNRKAEFEKRIKETINSQSNVSSQLTQFKQKNNIKNIENEPKTSSPEKNIRPKEIKNFKTPLESIEEEEGERKKTMEIFHPTISQYVKTSTGKKIKETLAERVRILEKHFGGSDDNQENVKNIKN